MTSVDGQAQEYLPSRAKECKAANRFSLVRFRTLGFASGAILSLYGLFGLLVELHLAERVAQGLFLWRSWLQSGQLPALDAAFPWSPPAWFIALRGHFDQAVLLVWVAWASGILLLLLASGAHPGLSIRQRRPWNRLDVAALIFLLGILVLGYGLRARFLLPLGNGQVPASNYDEMVYLQAARVNLQGLFPYRDFFLAHPPGIFVALEAPLSLVNLYDGASVIAAARWTQLFYGLASVALVYVVGRRIAGRRGGLLAALVLALDVQAAQVAPLEVVVNLASLLALWFYLRALDSPSPRFRYYWMAWAGLVAVVAAMTKVPGAVILLLLALLAVLAGRWRDLLAGAVGAAAGGLFFGVLYIWRAPGAFWRQVIAFQLLRPQETVYGRNHLVRMAEYPSSRLTFLLLIAAVLLITVVALAAAWPRRTARPESRPPAALAWVFPLALVVAALLALFSYGRAYHSRYYVQLIIPLALLVAVGFGLVSARAREWLRWGQGLAGTVAVIFMLLAWPHLGQQNMAAQDVIYDGTYAPIGKALSAALSSYQTSVLSLDPGYPLMAGRPPARLPDGTYIVDGAGLMVYRAMGIATMSPKDVLQASRHLSRDINPKAVFHQPAAQDVVVSALYGAGAAVIDPRIAAEDLTPQTQEFLASRGPELLRVQYTAAFIVEPSGPLGESQSGLRLWDLNMRPLTAQGEGPAALPGEPLQVHLSDVVQLSLYWYVKQPPPGQVAVGLELRDATGQVAGRLRETAHFGDPPASSWKNGWVYQDHHNMPLSPDTRPGTYTLYVSLIDTDSVEPWPWKAAWEPTEELPVGIVDVTP